MGTWIIIWQLREGWINNQWKVKHSGKNGKNIPLEKEVTLTKQRMEDAYMSLFYDLTSMSCLLSLQVKVSLTLLSTLPGQLSLRKSIYILSDEWYHHQQSATLHVTEIGSLYVMIKMKKDDKFIFPRQVAVLLATKLIFSSKLRKISWKW